MSEDKMKTTTKEPANMANTTNMTREERIGAYLDLGVFYRDEDVTEGDDCRDEGCGERDEPTDAERAQMDGERECLRDEPDLR